MSLTYNRLGSQGEIHLIDDNGFTLCGIRATHPNWIKHEEITDKDPLLCIECLNAKTKEEAKEENPAEKTEK
ncbi:MAG: hypothetical protein ACC656_02565 [Candidatus Heimdallarchaeota archaeon]